MGWVNDVVITLLVACVCVWLYRMADSYESAATAAAEPADDMTWNDFTVPQLKEELTVRGLETVGKKADLVARLEKYDSGAYLFACVATKYRVHTVSSTCFETRVCKLK